jgi:hypothetical protein
VRPRWRRACAPGCSRLWPTRPVRWVVRGPWSAASRTMATGWAQCPPRSRWPTSCVASQVGPRRPRTLGHQTPRGDKAVTVHFRCRQPASPTSRPSSPTMLTLTTPLTCTTPAKPATCRPRRRTAS